MYLRFRHKKGQLYCYCVKHRNTVHQTCYIDCSDKEYKKYKSLKQRTDKQKELEDNRYSIIQKDLTRCFFCGGKPTDWHELIKGSNRKKSIRYGLCVRVCRKCHRKTEDDIEFYKKTRLKAQLYWQKYYHKTEEEFIKEFGRSWLCELKKGNDIS